MRPGDGHRSRIWAPVLRTVEVTIGGAATTLEPGTWVESAVFLGTPCNRPPRAAFGATSPDALMPRRIGRIPDPHEVVIVPGAPAGAVASQAADPPGVLLPAAPTRVEPRMPRCSDVWSTPLVHMAMVVHDVPDCPVLMVADPHLVDVPESAVLEMLCTLEAGGCDVVVPLHNVGLPLCLPQGKSEPRTTARPMPGGRPPAFVAEALRRLPAAVSRCVSDRVGAALLTPAAHRRLVEALRSGSQPFAGERIVTCLTAYAWSEGSDAARLPIHATDGAPDVSPVTMVERAREVVAEQRPAAGALPVVFICDGVGPVGGTQVLLNLCDALNDLNDGQRVHASIVHKFTGNYPHRFVSKSSPLALTKAEMVNALVDRIGWERGAPGIVVATSWGTGDTVRDICERHPSLTPVAFWQDREDMFERHDGKPAGAAEFANYLAIQHRIAVSKWVLESAQRDRLIGDLLPPMHRAIVHPAVDPALLRVRAQARTPAKDRPVRILAMWRPMTAVRRGIGRLAALYAALAKHYSGKRAGRVSLEVFGWDEGVPAGVVSHGHLSTSQVAALMREVDIVVEPSEFQGFGLPGLEAMTCGAALVTTPCLGPDEYVIPGESAIVAKDHDSLLDAVRSLVDDPERLASVQASALATVPATWAETAALFRDSLPSLSATRAQ